MTPFRSVESLIEALYRTGGGVAAPKTFGRFVLAADVASVGVLLRNTDVFHKQFGLMEMMGKSRFNTEGDLWQQRRGLTQPQYNAAAAPAGAARVIEIFEKTLDEVEAAGISAGAELGVALGEATLVATTRVFLSALQADQDVGELIAGFNELRQLMRAMQTRSLCDTDEFDITDIAQRYAGLRARTWQYAAAHPQLMDLLQRFARQHGLKDGFNPMEEFTGNFFAGIETSSVTLSWAMALLGAFPKLQEELREEATGSADRTGLETFLNETLRFFPPIPMLTRVAAEDYESPELSVPKGRHVLLSVVGVHRDPDHWKEPHRFDPRRQAFRERSYNRRAFIPFLYGPRVCGGAALARIEITEGLVALLKRYRFSRTSEPLPYQYAVAMRPMLKNRLLAERL